PTAPTRGPLVASSAPSIVADRSLSQATGSVDTLIVAGGADLRRTIRDKAALGMDPTEPRRPEVSLGGRRRSRKRDPRTERADRRGTPDRGRLLRTDGRDPRCP